MTPLAAALLGAVIGLVVGGLLVWSTLRSRAGQHEHVVAAQAHLQAVVDNLRAVVVILGPAGSVTASSRFARASGLVRSTQLTDGSVQRAAAEVSGSGQPGSLDVRLDRGRPSRPIELELLLTPLADGHVLITGEDRSADLRFTETRRDFVANVTHELKTPIGAIILLSEALAAAADDPEAVRSFTVRLDEESQRLNELVSHIIALSRLQAEDPLLAAERVEVDEVIEDALRRNRAQAERRDITLSVGGERGLRVLGDAGQLEIAVSNLVQNAIAYSEPGARVVVSAQARADELVDVKVSDTGIGISQADLARVFERFYRVDAGRSRDHGGTGLGLSIVKHVAAAHGGEVTAWSRLGQGSTFTLRLPQYASEPGRAEPAPGQDRTGTATAGERKDS
ncbi:MAG: ATP-binding protein [Propionicimonas sp.]|uniref:sensor histidine kinase n=1 Tax=Propionicimonas sp. TaxID=1955623 RepID=UPI002B212964|nr:ATP-binding protein [Propionicimonas sp.]MEA4945085.1 ATP-binding protein [Propionicimonas sp.]